MYNKIRMHLLGSEACQHENEITIKQISKLVRKMMADYDVDKIKQKEVDAKIKRIQMVLRDA